MKQNINDYFHLNVTIIRRFKSAEEKLQNNSVYHSAATVTLNFAKLVWKCNVQWRLSPLKVRKNLLKQSPTNKNKSESETLMSLNKRERNQGHMPCHFKHRTLKCLKTSLSFTATIVVTTGQTFFFYTKFVLLFDNGIQGKWHDMKWWCKKQHSVSCHASNGLAAVIKNMYLKLSKRVSLEIPSIHYDTHFLKVH